MTNTTLRPFALATVIAAGFGFAFAILLFKQGYLGGAISIAKLADGATYTGDIQDGLLHGKGTLHCVVVNCFRTVS